MKLIFGRTAMWIWTTFLLATVAFAAVQELPEGDGKKILQNACTTCHGLEGTVRMKLDKGGWEGVVSSMVSNGAQVDAKDMPALIDYLVKNFGTAPAGGTQTAGASDAAAKKILENACTTCHDLDLVSGQRYTKDDWQNVVTSMIAKGASMGDKDVPVLVEYLAKTYPKK